MFNLLSEPGFSPHGIWLALNSKGLGTMKLVKVYAFLFAERGLVSPFRNCMDISLFPCDLIYPDGIEERRVGLEDLAPSPVPLAEKASPFFVYSRGCALHISAFILFLKRI